MICWAASDGGHLVDSCPCFCLLICVICFGMLLPRCNGLHLSGALRPGIDIAFPQQLFLHSVVRTWEPWAFAFRQRLLRFCVCCVFRMVCFFSAGNIFLGHHPSSWCGRGHGAGYNPRCLYAHFDKHLRTMSGRRQMTIWLEVGARVLDNCAAAMVVWVCANAFRYGSLLPMVGSLWPARPPLICPLSPGLPYFCTAMTFGVGWAVC